MTTLEIKAISDYIAQLWIDKILGLIKSDYPEKIDTFLPCTVNANIIPVLCSSGSQLKRLIDSRDLTPDHLFLFKQALSTLISLELEKSKEVQLSTDYCPEGILKKAWEAANMPCFDPYLLPYKALMTYKLGEKVIKYTDINDEFMWSQINIGFLSESKPTEPMNEKKAGAPIKEIAEAAVPAEAAVLAQAAVPAEAAVLAQAAVPAEAAVLAQAAVPVESPSVSIDITPPGGMRF